MTGVRLRGRRILITGASGAIGGAMAVQAARAGADLFLTGRDPQRLAATTDRCRQAGASVDSVALDLLEDGAVDTLVAAAQGFGRLNIIVLAAGLGLYAPLFSTSGSDFADLLQTHVLGPHRLLSQLVTELERPAAIVAISSISAVVPVSGFGAYSAAKAALSAMATTLAIELRPFHVRVLVVHPGPVRTPFFERASRPGLHESPDYGQMSVRPGYVAWRIWLALRLHQRNIYVFPGTRLLGLRGPVGRF